MAYNISYKSSVKRDLAILDKSDASRILNRLEKDLAQNPLEYPSLKGGFAGLRKYQVGNFRVIFVVLDNEVLVLRIGNRKDVYR